MRRVNATAAARRFSELLDTIESSGERFVIVRHGRPVATIGPAHGATGRDLKALLRRHAPDADWAGELGELRELVGSPRASDPWRD